MLKQVNPPLHLPVSLEEVKVHLRLDSPSEDGYLEELIRAATNVVETYIGRSLIKQRWCATQTTNGAGVAVIKLANPPLLEIIDVKEIYSDTKQKSIKRFSLHGNTLIPYLEITTDAKGVEVIYDAGYGELPRHVPSALKQAVLMVVAELYTYRELGKAEGQTLWQGLLQPFKVWRVL